MRNFVFAAVIASIALPLSPAVAQNYHRHHRYHNGQAAQQQNERQQRDYGPNDYGRYDYNQPDPRYGNYDPQRYYSDAPQYQPRPLQQNDRVYRGQDNQYYCRRNDGTTGLVVGGLSGGVLGNLIAPNGSKLLGAILGGGGGALLGRAIDRGGNKGAVCR